MAPPKQPRNRPDSPLTRLLAGLIAAVLRRRRAALVGVVLLILSAALGLLRLRVDFSSTSFYGDDSEAAARLANFHASWGADDDTLLILVHPSDPGDQHGVLTQARLAAIAELARALDQADEQVLAVTSIATAPLPRPRLGPGPLAALDFAELIAPLTALEPGPRQALLERLPWVPTLLAADGSETVILVQLSFSSDDVMRTKAALDRLEPTLAAHDPKLEELGLTRELAGIPAIRAGFFTLVLHDQARFIPLTLALIGLALLLVFRRLHGVLIPAATAAAATVTLVGLMAWAGEPVGLLNQAYFTLLPVIIVADAIHMVARFHEQRRLPVAALTGPADLDPRQRAIVLAGSRVGLACLLTSITTGAGFASFALADMPILRSFGLYAGLGVGLGFLMVIVLVPVLLSFVSDEHQLPELPGLAPLNRLVDLALTRPKLVLGLTLLLLGLALIPARRVDIDNTLTGLLDSDHPTSIASRRVDTKLGGVLGLEFQIHAPAGVDLRDPALLAAVHGFELWLAEQAQVRAVEGLASIVAGTGELFGEGPTIPATRPQIDARLDAIAGFAPLPRYLREQGRSLRIRAGLPDAGGRDFVHFARTAEAELQRRLAAPALPPGVQAYATGTPLLAYEGVNRITRDLRTSFALVFLVVLGLIAVLFRSLWPALVGILPNGLPLLLGYAALGLRGEVLDPLAAVILTLALAIAVDDTLHIMVRTREELRRGLGVEQALRRAIEHSGRAVVVTSVVIAGGLAVNLMSSFPPLQMLGLLGALVISFAVPIDLLVLPALIVLLRGRGLLD